MILKWIDTDAIHTFEPKEFEGVKVEFKLLNASQMANYRSKLMSKATAKSDNAELSFFIEGHPIMVEIALKQITSVSGIKDVNENIVPWGSMPNERMLQGLGDEFLKAVGTHIFGNSTISESEAKN